MDNDYTIGSVSIDVDDRQMQGGKRRLGDQGRRLSLRQEGPASATRAPSRLEQQR